MNDPKMPDLSHELVNNDFENLASYHRRPVAYRNEAFLDSPDARALRILSEYLEPLSHFRDECIQDTIVFFGSARIVEMGGMGRYYRDGP